MTLFSVERCENCPLGFFTCYHFWKSFKIGMNHSGIEDNEYCRNGVVQGTRYRAVPPVEVVKLSIVNVGKIALHSSWRHDVVRQEVPLPWWWWKQCIILFNNSIFHRVNFAIPVSNVWDKYVRFMVWVVRCRDRWEERGGPGSRIPPHTNSSGDFQYASWQ